MPSDQPNSVLEQVKPLLASAQSSFRSAVASTSESLRGTLAQMTDGAEAKAEAQAAQLGGFAADLMNISAFSKLAQNQSSLDDGALPALKLARLTLEQVADAGDTLFEAKVAPGKNIRCGVSGAMGRIGRAFAAARVIELAKAGTYDAAKHADMLDSFRYANWSSSERKLAPPITVSVEGRGLHAALLTELLDGKQKYVLLLNGDCEPAPLARMITPGTFVVQCTDAADLKAFAAWNGPGVAAIVPAGSALFSHDPQSGNCLSDRLTVSYLPDQPSLRALGSLSVAQQEDNLAHLACLAQMVAAPETEHDASAAASPVDQLAAFLLNRADLEEV